MNAQDSSEDYSIIRESYQLLRSAIINHPEIRRLLPIDVEQYASKIKFTGSGKPSIPVNWRFAESIAVLKALEGIMINALLQRKYDIEPQEVVINIDHAQLFIVSCLLTQIHTPGGDDTKTDGFNTTGLFPSCDIYRNSATPYRASAGNLYQTKDERFFHLHSDLDPNVIQDALDLPHEADGDFERVHKIYQEKTMQYTAAQLDELSNNQLRRSGITAMSVEEYAKTEHGRANAGTALWEIQEYPNDSQKPGWWLSTPQTSPERPLAGLKVVDFSRIIAAPTATRGLAEFGASVMRVTSTHLPDMGFLHPDMGWGKWNCALDFRDPDDIAQVKSLILDADVVVYGYRPGALDRYGLGHEDILELCKHRDRGIIVLRLDCYGWVGPWADRSGWQQISDACCGVSMEFGRAMHGRDEPVTPVFPNSDHCGGLAGELGVISALMKRAEKGGSYVVDCSLNAYSQWLTNSIGTYPQDVWEAVWALHNRPRFRHYHPMQYLFPTGIKLLRENAPWMLDEKFFEVRKAGAMGCEIKCVKPVLQFPENRVKPHFRVSARTNGVDKPRWPDDLIVDIVDES